MSAITLRCSIDRPAKLEVWDHEIFYTPWLVVEKVRDPRKLLLSAA